jgi:hypothetical protein
LQNDKLEENVYRLLWQYCKPTAGINADAHLKYLRTTFIQFHHSKIHKQNNWVHFLIHMLTTIEKVRKCVLQSQKKEVDVPATVRTVMKHSIYQYVLSSTIHKLDIRATHL